MNRHTVAIFTLLAVVLWAGCGRKSVDSAKTEEPVVFGPQHSAKKGLLVPEETRQSLGLRIVEVTEQKVPEKFEVQLSVYQVGKSNRLASGMVSPEKAKLLKTGQVVEVRTREGKNALGKVASIDSQLLKATGALELLVEIPEAAEGFTVGTLVRATVAMDSSENVLTIPRAALLRCSDGYSAYTVSGEHLVRTPIKIGNTSAELVEVKDGLYAGDKVVLQPVMSLDDRTCGRKRRSGVLRGTSERKVRHGSESHRLFTSPACADDTSHARPCWRGRLVGLATPH